jgi:hypothetical protein
MGRTRVLVVVAAIGLLAAPAAMARQQLDNGDIGHGACLLSTDPRYGHPIPSPGPLCIINLSTGGSEQLAARLRGFGPAQVPSHPQICYANGIQEARCTPYPTPGSAGGSQAGPGGIIVDPLRWPMWAPPLP